MTVDRDYTERSGRGALLGNLLFDLQSDLVVRVDVGHDPDSRTNVLPGDTPETAGETRAVTSLSPKRKKMNAVKW